MVPFLIADHIIICYDTCILYTSLMSLVQVSVVPEHPMREMKKLVNHSEKKLSSSQRSSSCIERWSRMGGGGVVGE